MIIRSRNIHTEKGVVDGFLKVQDGRIVSIHEEGKGEGFLDYGDSHIIPGFLDLHVHGFGTGSFWYEKTEESLNAMARSMVKEGVTTFLGTTGTDDLEEIKESLVEAKKAVENWTPEKGSRILGVHLEGPFINKEFKGMQKEEFCLDPTVEVAEELLSAIGEEHVYLMTLAPELPGAEDVIKYLHEKKVQISIGHSAAELEDIGRLKGYGLGGVTHMYSGMRGFHHRRPGVVGAALFFEDLYCEFAKQTGMTVSHEAFRIAYKVKGAKGIMLCTDCTGLAHVKSPFHHYIRKETYIPDGESVLIRKDSGEEYRLNRRDVEEVKNLEMGYFSSVKTIMEKHSISLEEIITMASENPAKYIGVFDQVGSLKEGKKADFLVLDNHMDLMEVYVEGISQKIHKE